MINDDKNKLVDSYIDSISVSCVSNYIWANYIFVIKKSDRAFSNDWNWGKQLWFPVFYPSSIISIPNKEHPTAVFWQTQKTSRKLKSSPQKNRIQMLSMCVEHDGTKLWLQGKLLDDIWGFPKMVVPNNHGFPTKTKWSFWGVLGVPPFKETPIWIYSALTNLFSWGAFERLELLVY